MCGRFTESKSIEEVVQAFNVTSYQAKKILHPLPSRYNIAPRQEILTIRNKKGRRVLSNLIWGLVPSWSKDGRGCINAKAETLIEKPGFRESFRERRCLIPADGFYEWANTERGKQPFFFQLKSCDLFAFAGLCMKWTSENGLVETCIIITTTANAVVAPIHDRMPVVLNPNSYDVWLSNETHLCVLQKLLTPYPAEQMKSHAVSKNVNSSTVDDESLIKPVMVEGVKAFAATK